MSKNTALIGAEAYFEDGSFERELARRVAYRSVSLGDVNADELLAYLKEAIQPDLESMGFVCRYLDNPVAGGAPFLLAERIESPDALTMLTYGHGDVVPGYDDQWASGLSPWVLTKRDDAWYGRGVADNKGQHTVNLAALREVIAARGGRIGYNVKMLFELGEERSSPGLRQVCAQYAEALCADVFIASDGPRVSKDQPTLFLGSRGHVLFELVCAPREGGLHSGNWGGIMKNPAVVLANAIGSLVDGRGRITIPGLLPPPIPGPVREALSRLVVDSHSLGRTIDEDWGEPGMTAAERLLGWNTLEVLTLHAGNPAKPANAIPPSASAHCQLRFVVGTAWERVESIVRQHLDEAGFEDVQVRVQRGSPATRLDPASPWVSWAKQAIRAVTGADPSVVPNLGGTVPNDAFSDILGLPTIWIPHSYPGCRQHAPNEHLPLSVVREGLAMMTSVFWELGEAGARMASQQHCLTQQRADAAPLPAFEVSEKSIEELQAAMAAGLLTSVQLVDAYLARIHAYDKVGPTLNAIITVNPHAREQAGQLDHERRLRGARGQLHGIPILVKDNYDTADMPTSAGSLSLATMRPSADAFQVRKLREAGAVILGKTALHELSAGVTNVSSRHGATRNPYQPSRVSGGSSGGTAVAVAASFAAAGMGSDTCGSIRIPAANQNLVGIRVTPGLSSRSGIVPLSSSQDVAGPLARSVSDLALILDATVGEDANDPTPATAAQHVPPSYHAGLGLSPLRGVRIGVLRSFFGCDPEDAETTAVVQKALDAMTELGAELIDVSVPNLDELLRDNSTVVHEFKFDLARYLAAQPTAPVKSLGEILELGLDHVQVDAVLQLRNMPIQRDTDAYRQTLVRREAVRAAVLAAMSEQGVVLLAYPPLQRKPAFIGEAQRGSAPSQLSASIGFPAIVVPAGWDGEGVPVGLELLGRPFTEAALLGYAYDWEQHSKLRKPPFTAPPLVNGKAPPVQLAEVRVAVGSGGVKVGFRYDPSTAVLAFNAVVAGLGDDELIAATLQRSRCDKPGPVIAHLLTGKQTTTASMLTLSSQDRESLLLGQLYVHLYTQKMPLGAGRTQVSLL